MKKVLGIIPARGQSKRIPRKNIKNLLGKPLIAYTIEEALKSELLDRLIVSTEDHEISIIAKKYGAEVPFMRPANLAEDNVADQPVFIHALKALKKLDDYEPEIVLNLRPTSPLRTKETIDNVIRKAYNHKIHIVRTMTKVEGINHPFWMYKLSKDGKATSFLENFDIKNFYQSQMLPPIYKINGAVDAYKVKHIYDGNMLNGKIHGLEIPILEATDIDTEFDFIYCEFLLNYKKN